MEGRTRSRTPQVEHRQPPCGRVRIYPSQTGQLSPQALSDAGPEDERSATDEQPREDDQSGYYGRVSNVEDRPGANVHPVGDVAQPNPVDQVAESASQLQAEAEPQQPRGIPLCAVQEDQDCDTDERDQD